MTSYNGFGTADPGATAFNDNLAITVGTVFQATATGYAAVAVRAWVPSGHETTDMAGIGARLYLVSTGALLASGAYAGPVAGWNEVAFNVALTANAYYAACVYSPNKGYAAKASGLSASIVNGPLTIPGSGVHPNGIYIYSADSFPTNNGNGTWFGTDVTISNSTSTPTTAADSFAVSEAVTRGALALPRTAADSLAWSEAPSRGGTVQPRAAADNLARSESVVRGPIQMARSVSDSFAWSEAANTGATVLFDTPRHIPSNWGLPRHIPSRWGIPRHI